ncbi:hypothetical protein ARMSODRAFT_1021374 [Armillaria solidipes]|uniref:Uncharacterized protein n=1 Tax=Armillaria solidipes TaxID=1076256 RepID=A0A2H3BPT3_9AGAR|nr:hypothetical protein ARMSODRAFT_1021374 [Armillaria solidipes]
MPGRSGESTLRVEAGLRDPRTGSKWRITLPSPEALHSRYEEETQPFRPASFITATAQSTPRQQGIAFETSTPAPITNNAHWSTPYSPSPWQRETAQTWMAPFDERFDTFHQDKATFGWTDDDEDYEEEYGNYPDYTRAPAYDLPRYPFPLPDSPPGKFATMANTTAPEPPVSTLATATEGREVTTPPLTPKPKSDGSQQKKPTLNCAASPSSRNSSTTLRWNTATMRYNGDYPSDPATKERPPNEDDPQHPHGRNCSTSAAIGTLSPEPPYTSKLEAPSRTQWETSTMTTPTSG